MTDFFDEYKKIMDKAELSEKCRNHISTSASKPRLSDDARSNMPTSASSKTKRLHPLAYAAAAALVICCIGIGYSIFNIAIEGSGNYFGLKAYEAYASEQVEINSDNALEGITWRGFSLDTAQNINAGTYEIDKMRSDCSYLMNFSFEGNNVKAIEYALEGSNSLRIGEPERNADGIVDDNLSGYAWFESQDTSYASKGGNGFETLTIDTKQNNTETAKRIIRLSLPLTDNQERLASGIYLDMNDGDLSELSLNAIESNAASLSDLTIIATASFNDGSTQTKRYSIGTNTVSGLDYEEADESPVSLTIYEA